MNMKSKNIYYYIKQLSKITLKFKNLEQT